MQTWTNSQPAPRDLPCLRAAGDAMADALEAAELLDVDVDQFAGMIPLVAADRLGGLERGDAIETEAFEDAADGCRRDADFGRDLLAGQTLAAKGLDLRDNGCRRRLRAERCGRDERSFNPSTPSALNRACHLRAVRGQTPAARAAASGVCPLSICRTNKLSTMRRQAGILMDVHPVLRESLKLRNSSFLAQDRMDNLLKAHT